MNHNYCFSVEELKQMVMAIRNIEKALGTAIKRPSQSEKKNRKIPFPAVSCCRELYRTQGRVCAA